MADLHPLMDESFQCVLLALMVETTLTTMSKSHSVTTCFAAEPDKKRHDR